MSGHEPAAARPADRGTPRESLVDLLAALRQRWSERAYALRKAAARSAQEVTPLQRRRMKRLAWAYASGAARCRCLGPRGAERLLRRLHSRIEDPWDGAAHAVMYRELRECLAPLGDPTRPRGA